MEADRVELASEACHGERVRVSRVWGHSVARVSWLFLALSLLLSSDAAAMPAFSRIVAFGDSFSDSGNFGRSTDAENWLEVLADDLGIPVGVRASRDGGSNYARGGATVLGGQVADLRFQLEEFASAEPTPDPAALYVMWLGFNDIILAEDVADPQQFANRIADGLLGALARIRASGGRHFLVLNPWDVTTTPLSLQFQSSAVREENRALQRYLDARLQTGLDAFSGPVHRLDVLGLSQAISADPTRFGASQGASEICPEDATSCDGYLWRDFVHPTSFSHRILADHALAAIPEPSTALLMGLGFAALAGTRSRSTTQRRLSSLDDSFDPGAARRVARPPGRLRPAGTALLRRGREHGGGSIHAIRRLGAAGPRTR